MTDRRDDELYADRAIRPGPPPELREPPRRRSRALGVFVATFALAAFAGVVWYAYDQGLQRGSETTAPLIKADSRPTKVRPEQPGGLQVPNQDKLVYDAMRPGDGAASKVERLLPPPEKPVDPPPPAPVLTRIAPAISPSVEAPVPPVAAPAAEDTGIPPARIVTPAPAPMVPAAQEAAPAVAAEPAPTPIPLAPTPPPAAPAPAPVKSVAPAPAPVPTKAPPTAGSFRIQLGALRDEATAESEWVRLKKRYSDEIGSLDRRIQRVDLGAGKGVFYRLQSSGVSEASAEAICAGLKSKGQPCIVVRP